MLAKAGIQGFAKILFIHGFPPSRPLHMRPSRSKNDLNASNLPNNLTVFGPFINRDETWKVFRRRLLICNRHLRGITPFVICE